MTKMCKRSTIIKETSFGRDMLNVLAECQLQRVGFCELDISKSIITLKSYLVKRLASKGHEYPSQLRFLYPAYFDSARVLLAECVAEFFQTGRIWVSELDVQWMEYIDHEICQIILTETDVDVLLRVLRKVQSSDHDLCSRWQDPADRARWRQHAQDVYDILNQLK